MLLYDEKVIGFIFVWMWDNFIYYLYIDEVYYKKGIGKVFLKVVIEKIKFFVVLKCLEKNIGVIGFYKKIGFIEKVRDENENGFYILFELN